MQIDLQSDELRITAGPVSYQSPGGRKFNGELIITSRRLLYDIQFDMSAKGVIPDMMFIKWGSVGYLEIDRSDIRKIEVKHKFLYKKIILTLSDGSRHIFNSGMLGSKRFLKAICL